MSKLKTRISMYVVGLFIMTIGVALSVKSNLGVAPVSSIPYTITCVWGMEMGKATILFHAILVLLQFLILRQNFKAVYLLQIGVGIMFGYFTTFCNSLAANFTDPQNIALRVIMVVGSAVLVAFGIFLYLPAGLIPLAGEGAMKAISDTFHMEFTKVKIIFDCTMVVVSTVICVVLIHKLGSVGVGTIISAVFVGAFLNVINRFLGDKRDAFLEEEIMTPVDVQA